MLLERDAEAVVLVDAEEEGLPEGDQLSDTEGEPVEEPVESRVHVGVVVRISELVEVALACADRVRGPVLVREAEVERVTETVTVPLGDPF